MSIVLAADIRGEPVAPPQILMGGRQRALLFAILSAGLICWMGATLVRRQRANADAAVPIDDYGALFRDRRGLPMGLSLMPSPVGSRWELSKPARAIRLGARIADLELASKGRDGATIASYYVEDPIASWVVIKNSDLIDRFAGELAAAFDNVPNGRSAAGWYRVVQRRGQDRATVDWKYMREARNWALDFEPGFLVVGEWLELARAAALRHDASFVANDKSRAMLAAALKIPQLPDDVRESLMHVQDLTAAGTIPDFHALSRALTDALAGLAR